MSRNGPRSAELAGLAGLLADRTRAAFCLALLDGRAWTAAELAAHAGVAASTTSAHLDRLITGGLLVQRRQGRHRYVQLAGPETAQLLEVLTAHLDPTPAPPGSLRSATVSAALARGRTCYDHLAGRLGVAITDAMAGAGLLDQRHGCALTESGMDWLTGPLAVDPEVFRASRRPIARECLDWTERRSHLAGTAGAQIRLRLEVNGWTRRVGSSRAVRLTPSGATALHDLLGLDAKTLALT